MKAKIIKSEADYEAALAYIEGLMDAEPGSEEEEELELFAALVEQYENAHYPIAPPDPIDAILFRMDQEGLIRKDMAAYIGSQSKVSEVLNRKRPLSLSMIRKLHEGLGIPADVLLREPGKKLASPRYDYRCYPFNEMLKCNYFPEWKGSFPAAKEYSEELLSNLFALFGSKMPQAIYCRRTSEVVDEHALTAWQARTLALAQKLELPAFRPEVLDDVFFNKLVRASYFSEGARLVPQMLYERGIHFVLLPHLPKTYLDGACFLSPEGRPVIGMTLRYDRLDNFWFTLAHELAHVHLHLHDQDVAFFDDIEHTLCSSDDPREAEANEFARNTLIPNHVWEVESHQLLNLCQDEDVIALADRLEIAPAIIAGRVRWEKNDYSCFSNLIGNRDVQRLFPDYKSLRHIKPKHE